MGNRTGRVGRVRIFLGFIKRTLVVRPDREKLIMEGKCPFYSNLVRINRANNIRKADLSPYYLDQPV